MKRSWFLSAWSAACAARFALAVMTMTGFCSLMLFTAIGRYGQNPIEAMRGFAPLVMIVGFCGVVLAGHQINFGRTQDRRWFEEFGTYAFLLAGIGVSMFPIVTNGGLWWAAELPMLGILAYGLSGLLATGYADPTPVRTSIFCSLFGAVVTMGLFATKELELGTLLPALTGGGIGVGIFLHRDQQPSVDLRV